MFNVSLAAVLETTACKMKVESSLKFAHVLSKSYTGQCIGLTSDKFLAGGEIALPTQLSRWHWIS
ncbi:hypothetical protein GALL_305000 [mine drainage metagenome]|uniref:Uncharacterized protein n=1 Tax=mine drainage metagenome TaxID=410659 RepID=A0A1J5R6I5_9ZZZZ